jgi:hypothetical protein
MAERAPALSLSALALVHGTPVVVYLQNPKEKVWGLLLSLDSAGVVVRGIDLRTFDDWMRQEARGADPELGLVTLFYPQHRVERVERDESVGTVPGYADRFAREVGRPVKEVLGFES